MLQAKVNQLLTEPACKHNHHHGDKKNRSCSQQGKPGTAQGGCAF